MGDMADDAYDIAISQEYSDDVEEECPGCDKYKRLQEINDVMYTALKTLNELPVHSTEHTVTILPYQAYQLSKLVNEAIAKAEE